MRLLKLFTSVLALMAAAVSAACTQQAERLAETAPRLAAEGEVLLGLSLETGVEAFLGIPYAAPPVGDRRWRPAAPHRPRAGLQDATRFGPACPQSQGNPDWYRMVAEGFGADPSVIPDLTHMDEDCLYLNIWKPAGGTDSGPLPVMIWVHGGSNVNGWGYEPNYIGERLAAKGVVVVTINYRLGALGFLPIQAGGTPEGPAGNYGLSDIVAATSWVRANAAALGVDPDNITLFGESAGGGNIAALLRSPRAHGLFRRAILQSGALGPTDMLPIETVRQRTNDMLSAIGIGNLEEASRMTWQELVDLHRRTGVSHYHGPVLDDVWVRSDPGINPGVDVLAGSNLNEMLMYLKGSDEEVLAQGLQDYPENTHAALLELPVFEGQTVRAIADALATGSQFHCPSGVIARQAEMTGARGYLYRFSRKRNGSDAYGAYHGAEIPYVFDMHDEWLPTDEVDLRLTGQMMDYWVNFARTGNPNGPGLPDWPSVSEHPGQLQELGDQVRTVDDFMAPFCRALDRTIP